MRSSWMRLRLERSTFQLCALNRRKTSAVTPPQPIKIVKAVYTPQGRAARIEGVVVLEAIVLPDGTVGDDVKVTRSLDTKYGLDEQAVKATKQWKFKPATRDGKPVACPVAIEQDFHLNSTK